MNVDKLVLSCATGAWGRGLECFFLCVTAFSSGSQSLSSTQWKMGGIKTCHVQHDGWKRPFVFRVCFSASPDLSWPLPELSGQPLHPSRRVAVKKMFKVSSPAGWRSLALMWVSRHAQCRANWRTRWWRTQISTRDTFFYKSTVCLSDSLLIKNRMWMSMRRFYRSVSSIFGNDFHLLSCKYKYSDYSFSIVL